MRLSSYKLYILLGVCFLLLPSSALSRTRLFNRQKDTIQVSTLEQDQRIDSLIEENNRYKRSLERYHRFWSSLIPNQTKVQYAGSIGVVSLGLGWHYGKKHHRWETDFMVGYLPRFESATPKVTLTLKQSYIPFRLNLYGNMKFEPLSCGIFFNTILGHRFWTKEPAKYPHHYYGFPTRIRTNIFIGERLRYEIPNSKRKHSNAVSLYYELSTCDLYLVSYVPNSRIPLKDILSLSLGAKVEIF